MSYMSWGMVLAAGLLAACSTPKSYFKESGTFDANSLTRINKDAKCNAQVRVGDWAAFATAFIRKYKQQIVTTEYGEDCKTVGTYECTSVERSGDEKAIAFLAVGYDPDRSSNFTTVNACHRWGNIPSSTGLGSKRFDRCSNITPPSLQHELGPAFEPYYYSARKPVDGGVGIYFILEDTKKEGEMIRLSSISFVISSPGIREKLNAINKARPLHKGIFPDYDQRVTYQVAGSEPIVDDHAHLYTSYSEKDPDWVAEINYNRQSMVRERKSFSRLTDRLFNYVFADKHRGGSVLTVTVHDKYTNRLLFKGKVDLRDARVAMSKVHADYTKLLQEYRCAK